MRFRLFHIMIAFGALALFSCQKELSYENGRPLLHDSIPGLHDTIPGQQDSTPASTLDTLQVSINGTVWTAQNISASAISGQLGITGSGLSVTPSVSLIFPSYIAPGNSYTLDVSTETTYIGIYNPTPMIVLLSTGGTLKILENNPATLRMRGNFYFQASDPSGMSSEKDQLTSGYFSVHYTP